MIFQGLCLHVRTYLIHSQQLGYIRRFFCVCLLICLWDMTQSCGTWRILIRHDTFTSDLAHTFAGMSMSDRAVCACCVRVCVCVCARAHTYTCVRTCVCASVSVCLGVCTRVSDTKGVHGCVWMGVCTVCTWSHISVCCRVLQFVCWRRCSCVRGCVYCVCLCACMWVCVLREMRWRVYYVCCVDGWVCVLCVRGCVYCVCLCACVWVCVLCEMRLRVYYVCCVYYVCVCNRKRERERDLS